jgi:peptide/nickel transport system substrate-binding protein
VEGVTTFEKRSERIVLEANTDYWDHERFPRVQRVIFDNTLSPKAALELIKTGEGRVDLINELRPLETLRVAESPFAKVVKQRGSLRTVFGHFNMRQTEGLWREVRRRQAINYAINREDLIRYATKGNGVIIPALLPERAFGYDPDLAPYPFDLGKAQQLLREAGYPPGRPFVLIVTEDLEVQATVVSKMLEQVGLTVQLQMLDAPTYSAKITLGHLDQPPEQQAWDIALRSTVDTTGATALGLYSIVALDGANDWVGEAPELRQRYAQVASAVDGEQQQRLIRQMERYTRDQAYFLFLYNPIALYAVNKAVEFVPHIPTLLVLTEVAVTEQHWSVRQQGAAVRK